MTQQPHDGQVLCDRYSLEHRLGAADIPTASADEQPGSLSGSWVARDLESNDRVVIRILPQRELVDADSRRDAESHFVHGLVHPNIVRTLAIDRYADGGVLVTAYIQHARSLVTYLGSRSAALGIVMQVLDALEYAHSLGMSHGNLCAKMILVDDSGVPHLISFGFGAYSHGWDPAASYLSPQVRSGAQAQPADDIYSLGAILYEIFTANSWSGVKDFANASSPIPESIQGLISRMLSESSYDRPDSVAVIRTDLKLYLNPDSDQQSANIEATPFEKPAESSPPPATSTNSEYPQDPSGEKRTISTAVAAAIFLVLLVLIGGVFFYLPARVSTVTGSVPAEHTIQAAATENASSSTEASTAPAPFELAQLEHFKEQAKSIAAKILREQIYLEDTGGLLWAKDQMAAVQTLADQGDLLFRDQNFAAAMQTYEQALAILVKLKESIGEVQSTQLVNGRLALKSGDAAIAMQAFAIVLAISPDHAEASIGFARAQKLDEVLKLLETAAPLENEGQLQEALATYRKAQSIDPLWPAARESVKRVENKITQQQFNLAMSEGFNDLKEKKFAAARAAFSQARTLIPDSQQPIDGLHQVDLAFRLQQIGQHKKLAEQFVGRENWPAAITEYETVLGLDSNLIFANKGLEIARKRLQLSDNLDKFINDPLLLNAASALEEAKQLLYQASLESDPGQKLSHQITALARHIKLARIPIEVELQSDKLTDIIIYKVGHLGRLASTKLELYPGVYTLVGKRRGYRDVRKQITLLAGQSVTPVFVNCTEKI